MPLIRTNEITADSSFSPHDNLQIYCGLDTAVTFEVLSEFRRIHNQEPAIYAFERAIQAPYLEIMQRGFLVDQFAKHKAITGLKSRQEILLHRLNLMAEAIWSKPLNPNSPTQLKDFFYSKMRIPEVWISSKGIKRISTNREALEKVEQYLHARPIVAAILALRDIGKQLSVFETEIDFDGRFRTSYNIAGTESGRPSSSQSAFGTGGNAQNIAPSLRFIFQADPGHKLCVIDLEQVEARDVGFFCGALFDDWSFLDSCESGDLHTNNAKLIWPERPWTGNLKQDRLVAEQNFYRDFSFRDMAKRGSHLSNYMGTAWTAGRSLKVPVKIMEEFQARYCKGAPGIAPAFPCIPRWWNWVASELQTTHQLVTPFGRRRHFFGRPNDDSTLREAIAFGPQSTTADRMNLGLWRVWHKMPQVKLLAQTFDSITFQYHESLSERDLVLQALELLLVELECRGRKYVVPGEAKIGWNWGNYHPESNVLGLKKFSKDSPDSRVRPPMTVMGK